ncbi:T6SS phospholipase effector Tle1-like catalytic domain-containing protein [Photorhabdus sp. SF281]|uniref:T6SS phospholipase effector Tle1-like catalytic domain-containing protein n=1 Tax=Photorhabdus sp. SF281 TaxID=3459527 RepID=UPI0040447993
MWRKIACFLSCYQVKVTTSCDAYGSPNHPINIARFFQTTIGAGYAGGASGKPLREAAAEFSCDYRGDRREIHSVKQFVVDNILGNILYLLNSDDEDKEYQQMKAAGEALVKQFFLTAPVGKTGQPESPASLLVALHDNQVHDSRAWFMYSTLDTREPEGGYFRYRVIYFGKMCNKPLSLLTVGGNVVGAESPVGSALFIFKRKKAGNMVADAIDEVHFTPLDVSAHNLSTRELIPLLPDAAQMRNALIWRGIE